MVTAAPSSVGRVTYFVCVSSGTLRRSYGKVFDQVASQYDRHRPTYPEQLVDLGCEVAGLQPGGRVLEIGCGSGQLTGSLLTRGLRVTAVEPGTQLASLARQRLSGSGALEIVNARLEDAQLPHRCFRAVFSASAIHWIDPEIGWRRLADTLVLDGTLALIQYFGLQDPRSADDQHALFSAMTAVAPEIAADWPRYRDIDSIIAGVGERRANVSEVWAWLGDYKLACKYVADLFDDVQIAAVPALTQHTAAELNALLGTMSFWSRLSPEQRQAMQNANLDLYAQLGRPIRSSVVACLVTARRRDHDAGQPAL